jgi:hypothetical protein
VLSGTLIMTLILALPSTDGLVVCADRRAYGTTAGLDDRLRKIHAAGDGAVFGSVGLTSYDNPAGKRLFDVKELVTAGLPTLRLQASDQAIGQWAKATIFDPLIASAILDRGLPPGIDQPLIQVFFFRLSNGVPTYTIVGVITNASGGDLRGAVSTNPIRGMRWASAGAMLKELESGSDPRFDDMRNHPVLSKFIKKEHPALLSTAETLKLLQWTITETSQRIGWLNPALSKFFGPTSDCGVITRNGVKWYLYDEAHPTPRQ